MGQVHDEFQFGTLAVKLGFTTLDRVAACVRIQEETQKRGAGPKKLGEIMIAKGYLTPEQATEIMRLKKGQNSLPGYKLLKKIGQGSMGSIYKAIQLSMDRIVAIKVLSPKHAQNPELRERFLSEARAVARLNHPNIIQGIDVGRVGNLHYFAMEYIDGPTVGELLRRGGALDEKRALNIAIQITRALHHAFQHGILHRDIKPDNIMLTRDGTAKLCDLGLAKVQQKDDPAGTKKGTAMGTPFYISPEQARGDEVVDTRSDIYSLCASFHHMVVGEVPFGGDNAGAVIARHLTEPLTPPRQRNPLVSAPVEFILMKGMQKQREDRYQMPHELLRDVEAVAQGGLPDGYRSSPAPAKGSLPPLRRSRRLRDARGPRRRFRR